MCRGHYGIPYHSRVAMADEYEISLKLLDKRLADGWELGKALETPVIPAELYEYRDHRGNWYKTLKDMAAAYGLSAQTVRRRLDRGLSVREALETPPQHGFQ